MRTTVITNGTQKEAILAAAKACGLSASSFLKLAVTEKINRMGIQINAVQSNHPDSPAPNTRKDGDAICQNATNHI